jgi:hypothetical protein
MIIYILLVFLLPLIVFNKYINTASDRLQDYYSNKSEKKIITEYVEYFYNINRLFFKIEYLDDNHKYLFINEDISDNEGDDISTDLLLQLHNIKVCIIGEYGCFNII